MTGGIFFVNILKKMWPLYNCIQLLTVLCIMNVIMPSNVHAVLMTIKNSIEFKDQK